MSAGMNILPSNKIDRDKASCKFFNNGAHGYRVIVAQSKEGKPFEFLVLMYDS